VKLFLNPGGNAYKQLSGLGKTGTERLKTFIQRNQSSMGSSAYAGICAGAYLASTAFL
jgi:glutamine amidotransferase-like uncharacterized protein